MMNICRLRHVKRDEDDGEKSRYLLIRDGLPSPGPVGID